MQDHILFKTLAFQRKDYVSSRVQDNILFVTMYNNSSERVTFNDHAEALEGLKELHAILTNTPQSKPTESAKSTKEKVLSDADFLANLLKTNSSKVVEVLNGVNEKLGSVVQDTKKKAESALFEAALKMLGGSVDKNINNLFSELEKLVDDIVKPAPDDKSKPESTGKTRNFSFMDSIIKDDIFGSVIPKAKDTTSDKLIGDMYAKELKELVSREVDNILNTERAQAMIVDIQKNFGDESASTAILKMKEIVYNMCLDNPEKTIKEVLGTYF